MIPTRPLGPGAPDVTTIGFGCMPLSIRGRPPEADAILALHTVLDTGVTLIDTANVYCLDDREIGHNERLVAKALASWSGDRDRIVVATKGGMSRPKGRWERNARPDHLRRSCERSLAALAVDRIDLYQLHAPDPEVPLADSVGALAELQREAKIRWIGLSNVSVQEIREAQEIVDVVTVQNRLNPFFHEDPTPDVVEYCGARGIGFLAYSPLGGGRLNKKLPDHPVLRPIAERHDATPHAVVVAWVRAQGPSVVPIPAARTVEHALDSIGAAELELSDDELTAINEAEFSTA